jgi:F-type H+-transporting ATPase subunit delta
MSAGAVAERYAQALFELGEESGQLAILTEKLAAFADVYQQSQPLRSSLNSPVISSDERRSLLAAIAQRVGVPPLGVQALQVVSQRGRISSVAAIAARLTDLSDKKNGILRASVTTASQMPESYFQSFTSELAAATKKTIILERSVDETLVGGVIARVGDTLIDGSIRGKLQHLEREILSAIAAGAS